MSQDSDKWANFRPDILGSVSIGHGGAYTTAIYFTSEAETRGGESKEVPPELSAQMEDMSQLSIGSRSSSSSPNCRSTPGAEGSLTGGLFISRVQ